MQTSAQIDSKTGEKSSTGKDILKMTVPTGRMQDKVLTLLKGLGIQFNQESRSYRPTSSDPAIEGKFLKAQNIPNLVALGRHDCGFAGYDWIVEQKADVVELLDLGFDPVRIVVAAPESLDLESAQSERTLVLASEYKCLAETYIEKKKLNSIFVRTYGATEALPPEDADLIIDNTATGATLSSNRLVIIDEVMRSTTRFICSREALENKVKRQKLEELVMLMKSSLAARKKVLLEMNVDKADFERIVKNLPCMKSPTVSELYQGSGYAVKIAVDKDEVPGLIPKLVAWGAKDILEYKLEKIV